VQIWSQSSNLPARRRDFRAITNVPVFRDIDLDLDLEHTLDAAHLETILCKFRRNRAICVVVEAICAKSLQTERIFTAHQHSLLCRALY